jgi:CBS domain-containing protein
MTSEKIKNITVSDFMTMKVKTITEDETLQQACKLMYQENIGSIIITKSAGSHDGGTPMGIVTERDIARVIGFSAKFFSDMSVSDVMSKPLITITANTSVKDAVTLMDEKNIRRLPVLNDRGQMVGIITAKDIFKAVMHMFKESMKDLDLMSLAF